MSRSHKGDANAPTPLEPIPAEKQREALALLEEQVFSDKPFNFPPELVQPLGRVALGPLGRARRSSASTIPAHDVILMWQDRILSKLLSSLTLSRMHDSELKMPADQPMHSPTPN